MASKDGGSHATLDWFGQDAVAVIVIINDYQIVVADTGRDNKAAAVSS
jgi:hypothetical protein